MAVEAVSDVLAWLTILHCRSRGFVEQYSGYRLGGDDTANGAVLPLDKSGAFAEADCGVVSCVARIWVKETHYGLELDTRRTALS